MRLWHYQLVPYLPRQQLVSQWRECVCIAKSIHDKGTPNHILVNKIMDYSISDFNSYCNIVLAEMLRRGYKVSSQSIRKLEDYVDFAIDSKQKEYAPFKGWHDIRYAHQCFYNLEEKFDYNGIPQKEWDAFCEGFKSIWSKVDFEPVIHAHWIHGWSYDKCSHCGYETGKCGWPTRRCPECGAHMDEV